MVLTRAEPLSKSCLFNKECRSMQRRAQYYPLFSVLLIRRAPTGDARRNFRFRDDANSGSGARDSDARKSVRRDAAYWRSEVREPQFVSSYTSIALRGGLRI